MNEWDKYIKSQPTAGEWTEMVRGRYAKIKPSNEYCPNCRQRRVNWLMRRCEDCKVVLLRQDDGLLVYMIKNNCFNAFVWHKSIYISNYAWYPLTYFKPN